MKHGRRLKVAAVPFAVLLASLCGAGPAPAQLRGHGGPVRAVAVSSNGEHALSGSFDNSAIVWSLASGKAEAVLRFHDGAVNAVAFLKDGGMATGGEDARIALWRPGRNKPERVFQGHKGPIVALAVSPDGEWLASGAWDQTARLWSLADGSSRVLEGHQQNVNGVSFLPGGSALVTVGYDSTIRVWPIAGNVAPTIVTLSAPLNAVAVAPDGEIVTGAANGSVYFLSPSGKSTGQVRGRGVPIIALALSPNGKIVAAADVRGAVAIVERSTHSISGALTGPGLPIWSATFLPDSVTLLTGGSDHMVRRWNAVSGEPVGVVTVWRPDDPLAAFGNDPGARVFRACVACHTLNRDEGNYAGPSLGGIFGRRIATLPGYDFSPALKKLDIVWTPETLSKLFEIGPAAYTPGTKMPEQRINSAEDRKALIEFLEKATNKH